MNFIHLVNMDETPADVVNFVPCVKWVKRGVAKSNPVKIELSQKELAEIIKDTKQKIRLVESEADDSGDSGNEESTNTDEVDEFNLENYDNEDERAAAGIAYMVELEKSAANDDVDSDAEDDLIKPTDNLILVGHVEGDTSMLEVYVYNEDEGSLYVHHDMILPSFPLALEWLNYDPEDVNAPSNLCAVGTMTPIIEVWDLDIVNSIEPAFKLGRKGSSKKGIQKIGHSDAVLDLCWNRNLNHILASGSADQTVLIWDLDSKQPGTTLTAFTEKVQSLKWHPFEGQTLLTGCCDKLAKVFDCRTENCFKSWAVDGEAERVLWNHLNPYCFFVSTNSGFVHCFDCRQENNVWKLNAHQKEVTGLSLSSDCPGALVTASQDGVMKTWDIESPEPALVSHKYLNIGAIHCLESAPDSSFLVCAGGDKKSNNFGVWHLLEQKDNEIRFLKRELVHPNIPTESIEMEAVPSTSSAADEAPSTSQDTMSQRLVNPRKKCLEKKHKKNSTLFKKKKKFKNV